MFIFPARSNSFFFVSRKMAALPETISVDMNPALMAYLSELADCQSRLTDLIEEHKEKAGRLRVMKAMQSDATFMSFLPASVPNENKQGVLKGAFLFVYVFILHRFSLLFIFLCLFFIC
jgi:hypothetical protein